MSADNNKDCKHANLRLSNDKKVAICEDCGETWGKDAASMPVYVPVYINTPPWPTFYPIITCSYYPNQSSSSGSYQYYLTSARVD